MNTIIRAAARLTIRPSLDRILTANKDTTSGFAITKRSVHNCPLTYDFARERIMLVLRLYDKIDPGKLTLDSHFINDLGLDSLDHTEIIMELEDEFNFEIPDQDAQHLLTPGHILKYISDKEECYKELQDLEIKDHHDHHGHELPDDERSIHGGLHVSGSRYNEFTMPPNTGHHATDNHAADNGPSVVPKRHFSNWSTVAKRFMSISKDYDEVVKKFEAYEKQENKPIEYPTSFYKEPPKPVNFDEIKDRVMIILSKYDKIDSSKLTEISHFVADLGLDSLDHVEIMMELEDEFAIEIPDKEAEKLMKPVDIARFIFHKEEARAITNSERAY